MTSVSGNQPHGETDEKDNTIIYLTSIDPLAMIFLYFKSPFVTGEGETKNENPRIQPLENHPYQPQ
jgi:hypothetical protein